MDKKFQCGCGFTDIVSEFGHCPVCDPMNEDVDPDCYFLRQDNGKCRRDDTYCPFKDNKNFDMCKKLE